MENASRALLIAGSVLITLMLVAVLVYAFNSGQDFNYSITSTTEDVAVASFNSKFSIYETELNYDINNNYLTASTELNTIADVVTAVNHAVSVNDENNDGYKYVSDSDTGNTGRKKVETENAVEVVIYFKDEPYVDELHNIRYNYLGIEPNNNVKSGYVYPFDFNDIDSTNRSTRISSIETDENNTYGVLCSDLLSKYTTSKLITVNSKNYTIYEYYFTGKLGWDNSTGKINSIIFTLVQDTGFESHGNPETD